MSGAAGSSNTPPRFTLDMGSLVGHMSEHDLLETCLALTSPSTDAQKVFDALIREPYVVQRVLEELQSVSAMPSDAADRWGAPAALHRCSKRDGNCLAELARAEGGAGLDRLYERLAAAKKAGEASRSLQAAVPARKQAALAHREGGAEGTAASATQAQAAAERLALDALTAHESPLKAATGVRAELRACGCCVDAESAFLSGFQGRSRDFIYHAPAKRPAGSSVAQKQTRVAGLDARRAGEEMPSPNEMYERICCEHLCDADISEQEFEVWRNKYLSATTQAAKDTVVKEFVWDTAHGQLYDYCGKVLKDLFGVGASKIAEIKRLAQEGASSAPVTSSHGMLAFRASHPPANQTSDRVENLVVLADPLFSFFSRLRSSQPPRPKHV